MSKVDFKKTLDCYKAKNHVIQTVEVPKMQYLMIGGHGDPNTSPEFQSAVTTLFPVAYKLKFASKQQFGKDYTVMPLEGQWWADDMETFTNARDKSKWDFTLMIMQPDWISQEMFKSAIEIVSKKDPSLPVNKLRLEYLEEGQCVQTLHTGSFDDETEILSKIHNEYIPANNLSMTGKHHEIYFSDFRKVAPEKLKTLLRQPVTTK